MISLEDFSKQNTNNMNIETNDNMFWDKMKNILSEVFTSLSMSKKDEEPTIEELAANSGFTNVEDYQKEVEAIKEELEEQNAPTEPQAQEPTVETPKVEEPVVEEPKVEEPKPTEEEPKVEEKPQENNAHLEELINSLKEEINALKEMNNGLNDKVKELSKEPSTKPVNTNAKPSGASTYSAWREQMRNMIG
jgi:outer membrane biosynthesis protein TonB